MDLGREPTNSGALADVRFGPHSGLESDIARSPKCADFGSEAKRSQHDCDDDQDRNGGRIPRRSAKRIR
jgi:hypothetical protein